MSKIEMTAHNAGRHERTSTEKRWTTINGRREFLPGDPHQIAKILKDRSSRSPASRARARISADLKARGIG